MKKNVSPQQAAFIQLFNIVQPFPPEFIFQRWSYPSLHSRPVSRSPWSSLEVRPLQWDTKPMLSSTRKDEDRPPVAAWCRNWLRNLCQIPPHTHEEFLEWTTLQGINISHLGKRKLFFKMPFWGDMLVPWRVCMQMFWIILGFDCFFLNKDFKDVIVQGRLFRLETSYRLILKHEFNGPGEDVSGIMISTPQAFGKITLWDVKSKLLIYANLCRLVP